MTKKQFKKLKPSELIRVAIVDLRQVEKDERYSIDMGDWHNAPNSFSDTCSVCLAGAAMAKSLRTPITKDACPSNFEEPAIRMRLSAINDFRIGNITLGVTKITSKVRNDLENRSVVHYYEDKGKFKRQMLSIARYLERRGL